MIKNKNLKSNFQIKDFWNFLTDLSYHPFVNSTEKWKYFTGICLKDLADSLQFTRNAFCSAIDSYNKEPLLKEEYPLSQKLFYFRYHFDYASILLITSFNHLASAGYYFCFQKNELLKDHLTPSQILNPQRKLGIDEHESFKKLLKNITSNKSYKLISEYRHKIIHAGYPVIKGELRNSRKDIFEKKELVVAAIGKFGNGDFIGAVQRHDYTIFQLMYHSSKLFQLLLESIITFLDGKYEKENFTKYNLSFKEKVENG